MSQQWSICCFVLLMIPQGSGAGFGFVLSIPEALQSRRAQPDPPNSPPITSLQGKDLSTQVFYKLVIRQRKWVLPGSHRNLERIPTLLIPNGSSAELSAFTELCENKRSLLLSLRKCSWGLHFPVGDLEVSGVWHDLGCLEPETPGLCLIPVWAVPFGDSMILVGPFTSGHFVIL